MLGQITHITININTVKNIRNSEIISIATDFTLPGLASVSDVGVSVSRIAFLHRRRRYPRRGETLVIPLLADVFYRHQPA